MKKIFLALALLAASVLSAPAATMFDGNGPDGLPYLGDRLIGDPEEGLSVTGSFNPSTNAIYVTFTNTSIQVMVDTRRINASNVEIIHASGAREYWNVPYNPADEPVRFPVSNCRGRWWIIVTDTSGQWYIGQFYVRN